MSKIHHKLDRQKGMKKNVFFELVELCTDDQERKELWFSLLDITQDNAISQEEFVKLTVVARAPIVRKSLVRNPSEHLFPSLYNIVEKPADYNLYHLYCYCSGREVTSDERSQSCIQIILY